MTKKHRILLQTNGPWLKTGLAEAGKTLLKYLVTTNKYEVALYATQGTLESDPRLNLMPFKCYGAIPNDQGIIQRLNSDPNLARNASYGSINIDKVIQDFKPTIYINSDDVWAMGLDDYCKKPWYSKIHSILHVTVDSVPVIEQAFEQAKLTKHYFTWAKFAAKEMRRFGPDYQHVSQIYGALDIEKFSPIPDATRQELRKRFGIADSTTVFLFVGRNQLRKQFVQCLAAFAKLKRENPTLDTKLFFHTSFAEKAHGWDIPKMAAYYGVKQEDVLATYVSKKTGQFHVRPYCGEDIDCPYTGEKKDCITATIVNGVSDDEMKLLYGISDAGLCLLSSGGQELTACQTLLCGKPLACTNYSSGEDFCEMPFVYKIGYAPYIEQSTNFIKATSDIDDIKKYMKKVCLMSRKELTDWGAIGREWAIKTFGIEAIGKQWEAIFDALPVNEWQDVKSVQEPKNENFPIPPASVDDLTFITTLYKEILKMQETPDSSGTQHWLNQLKNGMKREDIFQYFLKVAKEENNKIQAPAQDFRTLLDTNRPNPRLLFAAKQSIGDIIMMTQLLKSCKEQYPEHDIYFATEPQYFDLLAGNPYIFRTIPFIDAVESEMAMISAGQDKKDKLFDVYIFPTIQSQKVLNYLSNNHIAHTLT